MITYYDTEVTRENGDRFFVEVDSSWEDLVSFGMGIIRKDARNNEADENELIVDSFEGEDNKDFYHFALTGEKPEWMGRSRIGVEKDGHTIAVEMDFERGNESTKIMMWKYSLGTGKETGLYYEHEIPNEEFTEMAKTMYEVHVGCIAYWERNVGSDKDFDTTI